jgi:hypothetical protein
MMKNKVKRLTLALIAVGLSSPVLASTFDVSVPCQSGGLIVGGTGLYMMPSSNNTVYGASVGSASSFTGIPLTTVAGTPTFYLNNASGATSLSNDPKYGWGYGVQLGYAFPNTGNDVMAKYTHLSTASTQSSNVSPFGQTTLNLPGTVGTFGTTPTVVLGGRITPNIATDPNNFLTNGAFTNAIGRDAYSLNTIDLTVGQHVSIGSNFDLRLGGGVAFAQVENTNSGTYSGYVVNHTVTPGATPGVVAGAPVTSVGLQTGNSEFKGVGPEITLDGRYCIMNSGFGFDTHLGGQLLVGNVTSSAEEYSASAAASAPIFSPTTGVIVAEGQGINGSQNRRVVPELDANLAFDYKYAFPNQSVLTAQAGYQVANYFNVTRDVFPDGTQGGQNISFHGPFLTLKYAA